MEEKKLIKPIQRIKDGEPMPTGMPPMKSEEERTYFILLDYQDKELSNTWITTVGISSVFDELNDLGDNFGFDDPIKVYIGSNEDPILSAKEFYDAHGVKYLLNLEEEEN